MDTNTHPPQDQNAELLHGQDVQNEDVEAQEFEEQEEQEVALLYWEAPSKVDHKRGRKWYLITGFLIFALLFYILYIGSWSFAMVLGLLVLTYSLTHRHAPKSREITITNRGFSYENVYTTWQQTNGYWMLQGPDYVELHIEKNIGPNKEVVIHTADIDIALIRQVLSMFIPEFQERKERILDTFTRILKI